MPATQSTRIGLLTAALLVLAHTGAALAATNSVALSGKLAMGTTATATTPANTGFEWAHHITTSPAGNQPETADTFRVLFPSPLILNAQDFPACTASTADGRPSLSPECQNAVVGSGTATMYAGSPGSPLANSVREDLTVTAVNGTPAGSSLLLLLNSSPSAPIAITNRVVSGTIAPEAGYAFAAEFSVPADLQMQLGLSVVITDVGVTISGTPRPITVGTTTSNISYLQLRECGDVLPLRQLTNFRTAGSDTQTTQMSDATVACATGSFPDPPGFPTAAYTSPRLPAPPVDQSQPGAQLVVLAKRGANLGTVKARRNGRIPLPGVEAVCPRQATAPCTVRSRVRRGGVVLATLRVRVAAGAYSSPLSLRLTRAGRRLLAHKKSFRLTARITVTAPTGSVASKTLRLRLVR